MDKSRQIIHTEVLFEKTLKIIINQKYCYNNVWYFEGMFENRIFNVRHSTTREFRHMRESISFGKPFKDRCSKNGFYVVVDDRSTNQYIGKCDAIKIK